MIRKIFYQLITLTAFVTFVACSTTAQPHKDVGQPLKVLVITGQNNHYWPESSKIIEQIFDNSDRFTADIVTSPASGEDMSSFQPKFKGYDLICLDYNGDSWPESTKTRFEDFVKNGGGLVLFHASDNSFPEWKAYNEMIGLGGWGNRTEKDGPYVYWKDGKFVRDNTPGKGGAHGKMVEFEVVTRQATHPIMKGIPSSWLHPSDELYYKLRGPAKNMEVLATAIQGTDTGGSGRHEPILFTIQYGKGKVFHSVLGHVKENATNPIKCAGFITTLLRGAEWAATGQVTQKVSSDMPSSSTIRIWEDLKAPGQ